MRESPGVQRPPQPIFWLSGGVAVLVAVASIWGLLDSEGLYPGRANHVAFAPVDALNLAVAVPLLAVPMWMAWRGRLIGELLWPGGLFLVLYTYIPYVLALPFGGAFCLHLTVVVAAAYTVALLVGNLDVPRVAAVLEGRVPARAAGAILALSGVAFLARNLVVILSQPEVGEPARLDVSLWIADGVFLPAVLGGGLLLWLRRPLGFALAVPLLVVFSLLFVELVPVLVYAAHYDGDPIPWGDALFVFAFGLIGFIPLGLFVRAVWSPPER